ncbi:reverse transcriptase family protein [Motilimonas sp. 1_MG-2023]|uniref:reverse transcriptase family protein n=1 Tax=Motilimonas sp. 1_MG-2023 TaxID=3062672 RepID=UPI0026E26999|nr:reverse transcriptase family protein [Motilimonas sp. 1_MG-2023]MDO6527872.1 reverse transcriptase family protein [Motilimonas sp. 1_MG-2023]
MNDVRTLREVFDSTFHNKLTFSDLTEIVVTDECKKIITKQRTIYAPSEKLKKIHRFINGSILEFGEYNKDVVFSYRKGVAIRDAVEKHANNQYYFQTDIRNFFGSLDENIVKNVINNQLNEVPISDIDNYKELLFGLFTVENIIPAGFSTSPLLSNLCLFNFDNKLYEYCTKNSLTYTRYSDDIIISTNDLEDTYPLESIVTKILKSEVGKKLSLNSKKTKVQSRNEKVKILGFNILQNGIVTISSKEKNEVEILLNFYLSNLEKFDNYAKEKLKIKDRTGENKPTRELAISSLSGRLIGINAMDKAYLSKLRRKYGNTLIDMFLRKSVK